MHLNHQCNSDNNVTVHDNFQILISMKRIKLLQNISMRKTNRNEPAPNLHDELNNETISKFQHVFNVGVIIGTDTKWFAGCMTCVINDFFQVTINYNCKLHYSHLSN